MIRSLILAAALVAGTFSAIGQQPAAEVIPRVKGFDKFQAWSREVWAHTPGRWDDAARTIADWAPKDLDENHINLKMLVTLVNRHVGPSVSIRFTPTGQEVRPTTARPPVSTRAIKMSDVPALLALTDARFSAEAVTVFMKRAALLHTDIVLLGPPLDSVASRQRQTSPGSGATRIVVDGQDMGFDAAPIHWEFGRAALNGVQPDPAKDAMVSAWYRATAAYQVSRREFGYGASHLRAGRTIFPEDAWLQFYSGVLHEALAAPAVQTAVGALRTVQGFRPNVETATNELRQAETFFRQAVALDEGLAVARLHLGRVTGLLGHHDAAVEELRRALPLLTTDVERYYAQLFLGLEEMARDRPGEARAAFERARDLFPAAQSPHLALSQLAWQMADRDGALEAFQGLLTIGTVPEMREDPWWVYHWSAGLNAPVLIDDMRRIAERDVSK